MKKVSLRLGSMGYNIYVGSGLLGQTGVMLREIGFGDKLVVITDPTVRKLHANTLEQGLSVSGFKALILEVPEGEEQKSLETAGRLYHELTGFHAERTTPVLALGGGVIGDLAGFVAATYLRGVPLVQIPTTLLAQVDSSIGGKVAVNYGSLKNRVGVFYQPSLVISDINTLKTLTDEELSDGLAEVIKYGVIRDEKLFSYLERNIDRIRSRDEGALETVVYHSARIKARVVEKDEKDFGLRNILNYGHTVGHAIESVSDFTVTHGKAVALGMLVAARIANKMNILDSDEANRLEDLIGRAGLPTQIPALQTGTLIQAMTHDKKVLQGKLRFVLPKSLGNVFITNEITASLVEQSLVS